MIVTAKEKIWTGGNPYTIVPTKFLDFFLNIRITIII